MLVKDLVKEIRNKTGKSQEELGEIFGIHKDNISFYERGLNRPHMYNLKKLVDYARANGIKVVSEDIEPVIEKINRFADLLRKMRKELFLSQEAMAFELGFNASAISLYERGVTMPTIEKGKVIIAYAKEKGFI